MTRSGVSWFWSLTRTANVPTRHKSKLGRPGPDRLSTIFLRYSIDSPRAWSGSVEILQVNWCVPNWQAMLTPAQQWKGVLGWIWLAILPTAWALECMDHSKSNTWMNCCRNDWFEWFLFIRHNHLIFVVFLDLEVREGCGLFAVL